MKTFILIFSALLLFASTIWLGFVIGRVLPEPDVITRIHKQTEEIKGLTERIDRLVLKEKRNRR